MKKDYLVLSLIIFFILITSIVYSANPVSEKNNLMKFKDIKIKQNRIIEDKDNGKIEFKDPFSILSEDVEENPNVYISDNLIAINTEELPELNKPARITFYNVPSDISSGATPTIRYNEKFTTNPEEITDVCPEDRCSNVVYNEEEGSLSVDVEGFSSYTFQTIFEDSFENGLGAWTILGDSTLAQIVSSPTHTGSHSLKVYQYGNIVKQFNSLMHGKVTIWFYDKINVKGQQRIDVDGIVNGAQKGFSFKIHSDRLIDEFGTEKYGFLAYDGDATDGDETPPGPYWFFFEPSDISRTTGWHKLVFYFSDGLSHIEIDGTRILENTEIEYFQRIAIGSVWGIDQPGIFYDDIKVEAEPCADNDGDYYVTPSSIISCDNVCGPNHNSACAGGNDCNDNNALIHPGAAEFCDNNDNDCDEIKDENLAQSCYTGPAGTNNVGICHGGTQTCANGVWGSCRGQVTPLSETCNNAYDEDCNGVANVCCDMDGDGSRDEDLPDLSITTESIKPIQVIEGFELVQNKPTVVRVKVGLESLNPTEQFNNVRVRLFDNNQLVRTIVGVVKKEYSFAERKFGRDTINFFNVPMTTTGTHTFKAVVDPFNSICESNDYNNEAEMNVEVKSQRILNGMANNKVRVIYVPVMVGKWSTHFNNPVFTNTINTNHRFFKAVYPLAPAKVTMSRGAPYRPFWTDTNRILGALSLNARTTSTNTGTPTFIVGVVPTGFLPGSTGGLSLGLGNRGVLIEAGTALHVASHEMSHSLGIATPTEEYISNPAFGNVLTIDGWDVAMGINGAKINIDKNVKRNDLVEHQLEPGTGLYRYFCMMGGQIVSAWIDEGHYQTLMNIFIYGTNNGGF